MQNKVVTAKLNYKADATTVRSVITQDSQEIYQGYLSADGNFTATTGANKQRTTDYIPLERNKYYKLNNQGKEVNGNA